MNYREHRPHRGVGAWVRCYWSLEGEAGAGIDRVLPDGCAEIILHLADPFVRHHEDGSLEAQPAAFLVGEIDRPFLLEPCGRVAVFGARLQPGAAALLAGVPAGHWQGRTVDLESLWGRSAGSIAARIGEARNMAERARAADDLLASRIGGASPDRRVLAAVRHLARGGGVDGAAMDAGIGSRQIERLFRDHVGLAPKRLQRLLRFQRAVAALRGGASPAAAAHGNGYADQAHLTREFREFAGTTPAAFAAGTRPFGDVFAGTAAA